MRKVFFEASELDEFDEWEKTNSKIYNKIVLLISEILKEPFKGIGKPEPLKHELKGYWSRRINNIHRLYIR